jgi:hypothetical protein
VRVHDRHRYIREALALLAAMAPTLEQAIGVARGKAFVIPGRCNGDGRHRL